MSVKYLLQQANGKILAVFIVKYNFLHWMFSHMSILTFSNISSADDYGNFNYDFLQDDENEEVFNFNLWLHYRRIFSSWSITLKIFVLCILVQLIFKYINFLVVCTAWIWVASHDHKVSYFWAISQIFILIKNHCHSVNVPVHQWIVKNIFYSF